MIFLSDKEQSQFCPKANKSKFHRFNDAHETSPQAETQHKHLAQVGSSDT
jgi:hypothetical protein